MSDVLIERQETKVRLLSHLPAAKRRVSHRWAEDEIERQEATSRMLGAQERLSALERRRPRRWTEEDIALLQALRALDLAHWVIARLLSRSTLAVITKAKQLHLHRLPEHKGVVIGDRRNGIWRQVPTGSPSTTPGR